MPESIDLTDATQAVNTDPVYVRVRDKDTLHEYTVVRSTVDPEFQKVLHEPATEYPDGPPLPPKYHTPELSQSVATKAEPKNKETV